MGKRSASTSNSRLWPLVKGSLIVASVFLILAVASGYAYVKYIESRLHAGSDLEKARDVISEPIGNEPINILLLGSDARSKKENARTDTIIVLRVNPITKKVILLFIPRDMRVKIPGRGYDKINAANAFGGPQLAIQTVENFIDLPIHHYAEVNFWGFQRMIDALGGIRIDVDEPLVDKKTKFGISAGNQLMDGERALNYVRFRRDPKGDFGRIERQQKFFKALLSQSLRLNFLYKLPSLINIFADNAETDMTVREMLRLGNFLKSVDQKNVEMVMLLGEVRRIDKRSYVVPDAQEIKKILSRLKRGLPVGKSLAKMEMDTRTRVAVLNGSGVNGLAKAVGDKLSREKFQVVSIGNADNDQYQRTVIHYARGARKEALEVKGMLGAATIKQLDQKMESSLDLVIILGKDYKDS